MGKVARLSSFALLPVEEIGHRLASLEFICPHGSVCLAHSNNQIILFSSIHNLSSILHVLKCWLLCFLFCFLFFLSRPGPLVPSRSSYHHHGSRSQAWPSTALPISQMSPNHLWKRFTQMLPRSRDTAGGGSTNNC